MTARAEAQVLRLSVVYALLDQSTWITDEHQEAALSFWRYCRASTEFIFGKRLGDPDAERVLEALKRAGGALTKTDLSRAVGRGLPGGVCPLAHQVRPAFLHFLRTVRHQQGDPFSRFSRFLRAVAMGGDVLPQRLAGPGDGGARLAGHSVPAPRYRQRPAATTRER